MKKQPAVVFYIKKVFLKISKTSLVNTVLECIIFNKGPGLRSLWKMRLQLIFSCWFCEILKKFSSDRLLLFMKGTKNCLYCKSLVCIVKKKDFGWLNLRLLELKIDFLVFPWFSLKVLYECGFQIVLWCICQRL